jgi:hypothetical protein
MRIYLMICNIYETFPVVDRKQKRSNRRCADAPAGVLKPIIADPSEPVAMAPKLDDGMPAHLQFRRKPTKKSKHHYSNSNRTSSTSSIHCLQRLSPAQIFRSLQPCIVNIEMSLFYSILIHHFNQENCINLK